jgi:hypothetical protein
MPDGADKAVIEFSGGTKQSDDPGAFAVKKR